MQRRFNNQPQTTHREKHITSQPNGRFNNQSGGRRRYVDHQEQSQERINLQNGNKNQNSYVRRDFLGPRPPQRTRKKQATFRFNSY